MWPLPTQGKTQASMLAASDGEMR